MRAQSRLDDEQIGQLASAYKDGATISQLTEQFAVDRTTVIRHLDNAGVETRYRAAPLSDSQRQIAAERYKAGASMATIARQLGVTSYVIGRELRQAGVEVRPKGFQPRSDQVGQVGSTSGPTSKSAIANWQPTPSTVIPMANNF